MGDPLWSDRFQSVFDKAIPLLANLLGGDLLDKLLSEKCIEEYHYKDIFEARKRESDEERARSLYIILRRYPKPSFTTFCDVLLNPSGGAGQDLFHLLMTSSKQPFVVHVRRGRVRKRKRKRKRPMVRSDDLCPTSQQLLQAKPSSRSGDTTVVQSDEEVTVFVDVNEKLEKRYTLYEGSFLTALKKYLQEAIPHRRVRIVNYFLSEVIERKPIRLEIAKSVKISIRLPKFINRQQFKRREKEFVDYITGIMDIQESDLELWVKTGSCIITMVVPGALLLLTSCVTLVAVGY